MRSERMAIWISGEPVSLAPLAYSPISVFLRSAVIDIDLMVLRFFEGLPSAAAAGMSSSGVGAGSSALRKEVPFHQGGRTIAKVPAIASANPERRNQRF